MNVTEVGHTWAYEQNNIFKVLFGIAFEELKNIFNI